MNFLLIAILIIMLVRLLAGNPANDTEAEANEAAETMHPAEFQMR